MEKQKAKTGPKKKVGKRAGRKNRRKAENSGTEKP